MVFVCVVSLVSDVHVADLVVDGVPVHRPRHPKHLKISEHVRVSGLLERFDLDIGGCTHKGFTS